MAARKDGPKDKRQPVGSTTSLGKRRSIKATKSAKQETRSRARSSLGHKNPGSSSSSENQSSTITNPRASDYGSQATSFRVPVMNTGEPVKVAILGAAGGIGQPLSLLLMLHSEYVQHLALYDLAHTPGVAADLSHIDRQCKVTAHVGPDELPEAVKNAKVIIITAGLAQKPGMTRDDLFGSNAKIMFNLAKACAQYAPEAVLAIVSNPVNSLVPVACEVYAKVLGPKSSPTLQAGTYKSAPEAPSTPEDEVRHQRSQSPRAKAEKSDGRGASPYHDCFRRILGVTTLDVVRASTLTARSHFYKPEANGLFKDPSKISMPVIGGHAGKTILPILSQASPKLDRKRLTEDKTGTHTVIEAIQEAGIHVLNAKQGRGTATLSMAYATSRFTISVLRALQGEKNIIECAYVRQKNGVVQNLDYFATPILLGKDGYIKSLGIGKILPFEQAMVEEAAKELRTSVAKGEDFAKEHLMSDK